MLRLAEPVVNKLNWLYYGWKRNNWMLDLSRFVQDFDHVDIDRPIFLLGTQGGGLTLISRILRRHEDVVSVSGNCRYWSGADEMQNVLGPILPPELTGIKHKVPEHPDYPSPRGWLYAVDDLLPIYHKTEEDVTSEAREGFRRLLRWTIARHSRTENQRRFSDKSQIFTVKTRFINEILHDCSPMFVLVTRNPYAMCYRSTLGESPGLRKVVAQHGFNQALALAAQHWANSVKCALQDAEKVEHFMTVRFEDILCDPEARIREICEFADLHYDEKMLPQPQDRIPFGSRFRNRWYPLRPGVNDKYLREMSAQHVDIVRAYCEQYSTYFGYEAPDSTN